MTARAGALRVVLLTLGWVELPKSCSVHGASTDEMLREPVPSVLVQTDGGWVLLDTGYNPVLLRDPALYRRYHAKFPEITPVLPSGEGDPLLEALKNEGLSLDSITAVAISHLHNDHAGGLRHFAGTVPVYIQRAELTYGIECWRDAEKDGICRVDYDNPDIIWMQLDGDSEIAPGITALSTPSHTPGHQSFAVRLDPSVGGGGFIFAFDAADLTENIVDELPIGGVIGCDPIRSVDVIRRLKALSVAEGLRLIPGHDPHVWPALSEELRASHTSVEAP